MSIEMLFMSTSQVWLGETFLFVFPQKLSEGDRSIQRAGQVWYVRQEMSLYQRT